MTTILEFRWTVSRGRDTYGYNVCSLYVDGRKVAACNGGGYDMKGTSLGNYIAVRYADRLCALKPEDMPENRHCITQGEDGYYFYGLSFHDPDFDPGKAVPEHLYLPADEKEDAGKTVEQLEAEGKTFGLERYQAFHRASSKVPTKNHVIPQIDGACGFSSVERIMKAIGLSLEYIPTRSQKLDIYKLHDTREQETIRQALARVSGKAPV